MHENRVTRSGINSLRRFVPKKFFEEKRDTLLDRQASNFMEVQEAQLRIELDIFKR